MRLLLDNLMMCSNAHLSHKHTHVHTHHKPVVPEVYTRVATSSGEQGAGTNGC